MKLIQELTKLMQKIAYYVYTKKCIVYTKAMAEFLQILYHI